jgi:hypothetical protein
VAKCGLTPVAKMGSALQVLLIAPIFSSVITYLVDEPRNPADLRRFAHVDQVPSADVVYRSLGRSTEDLFVVVVNALLWTRYGQPRWRTREIYSIDGSTITLGLNIFKKRYRKTGLVNQDYTRGHSPTNGYYFGYKLTLVIEHPSLIPVAFLLHRRPSGDARFLPTVPVDLNRKILRAEDTVIPSSVILQQAFDEKRKLQRVAEAKSYGFMHHPRRQNTMLPARSTETVAQKGISGTCPLHAAQKDRCRNVIRIWR